MRIYLDNCCYNRPFNDRSQERIRLEAITVLAVILRAYNGIDDIVGSEAVEFEIGKIESDKIRMSVNTLYGVIQSRVEYTAEIVERSQEIMSQSRIRLLDSLHIACAESAEVYALLTTDDRLERACARIHIGIKVMNPVEYILEVENENDQ